MFSHIILYMKFTQFIKEFRSAHPDLNMSFKECMQSDDIKGAYKDIIGAGLAKKPAKIAESKKVQEILGKEDAVGEWKKPPEERGIKGGTKAKRGKDCPPCPPCDRRRCVGDKGKRGGGQQKEYKLKGKENIQIIINNAAPSEGESKPPVTPGVLPMKQIKPEPGPPPPPPQAPPAGPPATPTDFGQAEAKEDDDDDDDFPPPPSEYPDVDPKYNTYVSPDSTFPTFYRNAPISPHSYNVPSGLLLPDQYGFYADHRGFYPHTRVGAMDPFADPTSLNQLFRAPVTMDPRLAPLGHFYPGDIPIGTLEQLVEPLTDTDTVSIRRPQQTPRRQNYTNKGGVGQQVLVKRKEKPVVKQSEQTTTDPPVDQPYVQDDDDIPGEPTTVHTHPGVEAVIPPPAPYPPYGPYPVYHTPPKQPFPHATPYVAPTPYVTYVAPTPYIHQMPLVPPYEVPHVKPSEPMDVEEQVDATKTIKPEKVYKVSRPSVKPSRKQVSTRAAKLDTRTDVSDMPRKKVTEIPDVPDAKPIERKKRSEDKRERQVFEPEKLPPRTSRKELPTMEVQNLLMPMRLRTDPSKRLRTDPSSSTDDPSSSINRLHEPSPELPVPESKRVQKEKFPFSEVPHVETAPKRRATTKSTRMPFGEPKERPAPAPAPAPRSRTVAEPRTEESRKRNSPEPAQAVDEATYRDVAANILRIAYLSGERSDQLYHPEAETNANIFANEMIRDGLDARRLAEYVRDAASGIGRPRPSVQVKKGGKFVFGRGLKA